MRDLQEKQFLFMVLAIILLQAFAGIDNTYPAPRGKEANRSGMRDNEPPTRSEEERERAAALGVIPKEQRHSSDSHVNEPRIHGEPFPEIRPSRPLKEELVESSFELVQKTLKRFEKFTGTHAFIDNSRVLKQDLPAPNVDEVTERYRWEPVREDAHSDPRRAKLSLNEKRLVREAVRTFAEELRQAPLEVGRNTYSPIELPRK